MIVRHQRARVTATADDAAQGVRTHEQSAAPETPWGATVQHWHLTGRFVRDCLVLPVAIARPSSATAGTHRSVRRRASPPGLWSDTDTVTGLSTVVPGTGGGKPRRSLDRGTVYFRVGSSAPMGPHIWPSKAVGTPAPKGRHGARAPGLAAEALSAVRWRSRLRFITTVTTWAAPGWPRRASPRRHAGRRHGRADLRQTAQLVSDTG